MKVSLGGPGSFHPHRRQRPARGEQPDKGCNEDGRTGREEQAAFADFKALPGFMAGQ
jgi:hypothetical protein